MLIMDDGDEIVMARVLVVVLAVVVWRWMVSVTEGRKGQGREEDKRTGE